MSDTFICPRSLLSDEQGFEFWDLWQDEKVNFGEYPPYVRIYLPGPSTQAGEPK